MSGPGMGTWGQAQPPASRAQRRGHSQSAAHADAAEEGPGVTGAQRKTVQPGHSQKASWRRLDSGSKNEQDHDGPERREFQIEGRV